MKLSSITHALLLSGLSIAAAACSDAHAMERLGASDEALTASAPSTIQVIDPVQVAAPAAAAQTGSGVRTALVLDGFPIAWTTASGGTAVGTVITDSTSRKRIGSVHYEEMDLDIPGSADPRIYTWLSSALQGTATTKSGSIVTVDDLTNRAKSALDFNEALITEVGFPALDAAAKDAGKISLTLAPRTTQRSVPSPTTPLPNSGATGQRTKAWSVNNYRLTIDGLDCTRVSRIEPLTAKTGLVQNQRTTAHTDVSSLVVTLPAASAESFLDWHDDFVVAGHNDPSHEKSGTLQIMSADLRPVFTISLVGCGIYKAETLPTASSEDIPKVQASLYCNDMSFTAN